MAFLATPGKQPSSGDASTIWSELLNSSVGDVAEDVAEDVVGDRHVIIIGTPTSGKTSLVQTLKQHTALGQPANKVLTKSGYALDYYYIDVKDDEALDIDEKRTCSIWVLRGSAGVEALVQSSYSPTMLQNTLFTIALDYSKPWNIQSELEQAIKSIQTIVESLQVPSEEVDALKHKLERKIQMYSLHSQSDKPVANVAAEDLLPLGQGVLTNNLGLSLMVVCTKIDSTSDLEKIYNYSEEHFDFIQQYLRTECLKYGASLVYMSSKDPAYAPVLYKFILHSLFSTGQQTASLASVVEKESIFVPSGWDSLLKIKTVQENLTGDISVDSAFSKVIKPQTVPKRSVTEGQPFVTEDEQSFVTRAQGVLAKPASGSGGSVLSPNPNMINSPMKPRATPSKPIPGVAAAGGGAAAANPSEANLQHFFNSLLNTKNSPRTPGSASGAAAPSPNVAMAALQNSVKSHPATNNIPNNSKAQPTQPPAAAQ